MSDKMVLLTDKEREALAAALDYYLETLDICVYHDIGQHEDESECEGWGPTELAILEAATNKVASQ